MGALREFSLQADASVLDEIQAIAHVEGRQLQSVVTDALREYVTKKRQPSPQRDVVDAVEESVRLRDELYRDLAK